MKNGKRTKKERFLNMRLPEDVWLKLQEEAKREERTMAWLARLYIRNALAQAGIREHRI